MNIEKQYGAELFAKTRSFKSSELNKFYKDLVFEIERLIQSDQYVIIQKVEYFIANIPSGKGCGTSSREYESIMNKKSVISIINDNNNCFWYAEACLLNPTNKTIRDHRNVKARDKVAMTICNKSKLQWDTPMRIDNIIFVEKTYNININVIEMQNLPILGGNVNIFNSLLYKSDDRDTITHYLLYDSEKEHYNAITDIKAFLGVRCFCNKCLKGFSNKANYENHECNTNIINKRKVDKRTETKMVKELGHYLTKKFTKGSSQEYEQSNDKFKEHIKYPRYIIYDFETDTDTSTHKPNHVEVDVLRLDEDLTHQYDKCLIKTFGINGYDCENKFCDWLFTDENSNTTVMAHNGAGYDNKFILQYCLTKGIVPSAFIRQGSRITYMSFKRFRIRFIDSYHFFYNH